MIRKPDPTKKKLPSSSSAVAAGELSNSRFFNEIETLSKALALDGKNRRLSLPADPRPRPEPDPKSKPASIWSWKRPLKALSHLRHPRRFDCQFSLTVHSIVGLPPALASSSLVVHWRRASDPSGARTRPARAVNGSAAFQETLTCRCSVYGSRGGGPHGTAKYEPRQFLIYATLVGATGFDFGKHRIDLTRILPLTIEELEGERSSGEWSTNFRLAGKARGACLNVSFGYNVAIESGGNWKRDGLLRAGSVCERTRTAVKVEEAGVLREVVKLELETIDTKPEYEVFDELSESPEVKFCTGDEENECDEPEFTVIEQGVEIELKKSENIELERVYEDVNFQMSGLKGLESSRAELEQTILKGTELRNSDLPVLGFEGLESPKIDFEKTRQVGSIEARKSENVEDKVVHQENEDPMQKDLDLASKNLSIVELEGLESPRTELEQTRLNDIELGNFDLPILGFEGLESSRIDFERLRSNYKARGMKSKSLSFDDATESIANEFLSMLDLENSSGSDPESPREQLWKQFKEDSLNADYCIFPRHAVCSDFSEEFDPSSMIYAAETEQEKASLLINGKSRAKTLEDAETEALMREWGLNENVFEGSEPTTSSGFGSPIHLPPEEPLELPPLGENLGPFLQTKDGGFLRSMSPSLFKGSKNSGRLVMQASSPIVVPAEMGSDIMEILQGLASIGIEKLSMQAVKLMPLEDITGKTVEQVAWEAEPSLESYKRPDMLQDLNLEDKLAHDLNASCRTRKHKGLKRESLKDRDTSSEYVSLEDLAPLAMDKIEALSIEGLRIQSGMSDEEAPSNIGAQFIGEISALEGKGVKNSMSLGLEGAAGLQLLDVKDSNGDVDGLMGLSISLDEWMRLDSGVVDEEDVISDRTTKVLAAHHAKSTDFLRSDKRGGKSSGSRWGLLGNNFTVALMVQLRDPLRNYEPVGTPMLSLIQVERVFIPPKPKIYSTVSERGNSEQSDEADMNEEPVSKGEKKVEDDAVPQFTITEVHIAGLKTEPTKKKLWGNTVQEQSGSRWLLATGMGKSNKHPFMKSNAVAKPSPATAKVQPGDTLWSMSSRVHGTGAKWKELAALNPRVRNPNVILPNETIRLR